MKKIILATLLSVSFMFAASETEVTVNETMQMMHKGINTIEHGFFYSQKQDILDGIDMIEEANNIFKKIDVKTFLNQGNVSVQVVNNISSDIAKNLKEMKKSVAANNSSDTSHEFGELINDCIACHIAIRKW